uniref:Ig-like domain-containing protein n=1 Tax=Cyprinus carpio TaxID=7962 RepID=A0A8C1KQ56_CYPCA
MNPGLVFLIISLQWITGFADVNAVTQSPNFMLAAKENATLNCNHTKGDTYNRMYWFRQHQGKTMELILEKTKYSVKHESAAKGVLTVISLESDDNALYLCAVTHFGNGTKLTVLAANVTLPKVKILPPSPKEICSQAKINDKRLTLVCVASGFYPDHVSVSWKVNGVERQDSVSTDTSAQQNKTTLMYHISSRIKVNDTDWMDPKSSFTCTVHFFNGEKYVNVTNTINGQKGL